MDTRDIIISVNILCNYDWDKTYEVFKSRETDLLDVEANKLIVEAEKYNLIRQGYKFLVITDEEYPETIKQMIRPPFVIYYRCKLEDVWERYMKNLKLMPPLSNKRIFVS